MRPPELITPAHYTNWMPFTLVRTPTGLSIASRTTPKTAIAFHTAVIAIVFIFFAVLTYYKSEVSGAFGLVLALGVITTVGTPLAIVLKFKHQQRLGPVLVFNASEKTLSLPRLAKRFMLEEVDCFCLVTASSGSDRVSQFQLHTRQGARFLLVPAYTRQELDPMLKDIISQIPVPVRCYTEDRKAPEKWREESFNVA